MAVGSIVISLWCMLHVVAAQDGYRPISEDSEGSYAIFETNTSPGYSYNYYPQKLSQSGRLVFEVKAESGVHVTLSPTGSDASYQYEIVIDSQKIVFRRCIDFCFITVAVVSPIISDTEFTRFYISYNENGKIQVGVDSQDPLIDWTDPQPITVNYFGWYTGPYSSGMWRFFVIPTLDDPCTKEPCQNGGQCYRIGYGDYECKCSACYGGKTCSDLLDPCSTGSCRNGGTCVSSQDCQSFTCSCTQGFVGRFCETDNEKPNIQQPDNIIVSTDPDSPTAVVTFPNPEATDNSGKEPTVVCEPKSGTAFPIGQTTVECKATDDSGNTDSVTFTVTVEDNEKPQIDPISDILQNTDPGRNTAIVTFRTPTATDNSGTNPTAVCQPPSGSSFPIGSTEVTCTATDDSGNTEQITFTVTIQDAEKPKITCSLDISTTTDPGKSTAKVSFELPTATDNAGNADIIITCDHPEVLDCGMGETLVTCIARDRSDNEEVCSFMIRVTDDEGPQLTCSGDVETNTDFGSSVASVEFTPTATDNSKKDVQIDCTYESPMKVKIGSTSVTCTATDTSDNSEVCTFVINVKDNEKPNIQKPDNIIVSTDPDSPTAVVTFPNPEATDNSGKEPTVVCEPKSGTAFPIGQTTVECKATDDSGNTDSVTFTVTVVDNQKPNIQQPDNIIVGTDPNSPTAIVTFPNPEATDNSGKEPTIVCEPKSETAFPIGQTTVECKATDDSGNTDSVTFTVTVVDNQKPNIQQPDNIIVSTDPDLPTALVTFPNPEATDNSGKEPTIVCEPKSETAFPIGQNTVECKATDDSGNTDSVTFTVTVVDNQKPNIQQPDNIIVGTDPNSPTAIVTFPNPEATDNSGKEPTIVCEPKSETAFPIGQTTVACRATDDNGNTDSVIFTVTVVDNEDPVLSNCQSDITVKARGSNEATVTFTLPSVQDNSGRSIAIICNSGGSLVTSPSIFSVGVTRVVCTATDVSGNAAECEFSVVVERVLVELNVDKVVIGTPQDTVLSDGGSRRVQLDVTFTPSEDSADVVNSAGDDRYDIIVFLSRDPQGTNPTSSALSELTIAQRRLNIQDNVQQTFENIQAEIDLTNVDCFDDQLQYICIDLGPSTEGRKTWDQANSARRIACTQFICKSSVDLSLKLKIDFPRSSHVVEGKDNLFLLCLYVVAGSGTSQVVNSCSGDDRYKVVSFLATDSAGSNPVAYTTGVIPTDKYTVDLEDNTMVRFYEIVFNIDAKNVACSSGLSHLCVVFGPSDHCANTWCASPASMNQACVPIVCTSITALNVDEINIDIPTDSIVIDKRTQDIQFDLTFTPEDGSASVVNRAGDDRYKVEIFLSDNPAGSNSAATSNAQLTSSQSALDIRDGVASTFNDITTSLDLSLVSCFGGMYRYFCATLSPSTTGSTFWRQSDNAITTRCAVISCAATARIDVEVGVDDPKSLVIFDGGRTAVLLCVYLLPHRGTADIINSLGELEKFQVTSWLAEDEQGNGAIATVTALLNKETQIQTIRDDEQFVFFEAYVEYDLTNIDCSGKRYTFVCTDVGPSDAARPFWAQSPQAQRTFCTRLYCVPQAELNVNDLQFTSNGALLDGGVRTISVDVSFTPSSGTAANVNSSGPDRYNVLVFLSSQENGVGVFGLTNAVLSDEDKRLDVQDGQTSVLDDLTVSLDLTNAECSNKHLQFICATLLPSEAAKTYWAQSRQATTTHCVPFDCYSCKTYISDGGTTYAYISEQLQTTTLSFEVKAESHAFIRLSPAPRDDYNVYDIRIGASINRKISIWRGEINQAQSSEYNGILNINEFTKFWITFRNGLIAVGYGGSSESIVEWQDPNPLPVSYLGVRTARGPGSWRFCAIGSGGIPEYVSPTGVTACNNFVEKETDGDCDYQFTFPRRQTPLTIAFQVQARQSAQIALSSSQGESVPMYEIVIGAYWNTLVCVRRCKNCADEACEFNPWLLTPLSFNAFTVTVDAGTITVRNNGNLILQWTDPQPFYPSYFSYCTNGYRNTGIWRFCDSDEY
ncbi:serine-rich adhesin for platelets-like isoform X2 [Anneissia japonica]|uniref:serine-rich adhesin for platelets-like isoform X2 n=1 Tax=Anneissia japonica TaxID=1529436 RepID=UPI0014254C19|nr:serine-rich adhesin for platelets-like isoform X2 [Anneissia japonica]